ncbi:MAG: hypothetical protein HY897_17280 [Deltaproteobacteria bacterium]|nr:hypothetical protein [Deltaproteobacteria bacterium]
MNAARKTVVVQRGGHIEVDVPELPEGTLAEVIVFQEAGVPKRGGKPAFGWAGALSDMRERYTSVDLQNKAADWRIGAQ